MICEECGSSRVHWRCDNYEKRISKYKCQECGHIIITKRDNGKIFSNDEIIKLQKECEKTKKKNRRRKIKERRNVKIYSINRYGSYVVRKWVDGKFRYFGCYKDKETTEKVIEKLKACGWDLEELPRIKEEVIG